MINVILKGRLGNNLFQIAAGASLAKANQTQFVCLTGEDRYDVPDEKSLDNYLQSFATTILRKVTLVNAKPSNGFLYEEKQFSYLPIPYQSDMILSGYFQSEEYFDKQFVRELFEIDDWTKTYIQNKYGHLFEEPITSIHIRRGDYLANLDFHPICSLRYFRNAIERIGKNSRFLIVSNDLAWCRTHFKGDNFFFMEEESAVVDLYVQTFCANNIISNSSFSWWGAWLNEHPEKKVICPTPWFGISATTIDTKDLLPAEWIQIKNPQSIKLYVLAYLRKWKRDLYHFIFVK